MKNDLDLLEFIINQIKTEAECLLSDEQIPAEVKEVVLSVVEQINIENGEV